MRTYLIRGNHPIMRYINLHAEGLEELDRKVAELEDIGYEVTTFKVENEEERNGEHGPPSRSDYHGNIPK